MKTLAEHVDSVRSKNAGPFWVTIDVFCGNSDTFDYVSENLSTEQFALIMQQPASTIKRFDIPALHVIKFSLPRPVIQGHYKDRDMHGAQWSVLLQELPLP